MHDMCIILENVIKIMDYLIVHDMCIYRDLKLWQVADLWHNLERKMDNVKAQFVVIWNLEVSRR